MVLFTLASKLGLAYLETKIANLNISSMFVAYTSPTMLLSGIFLLLMFRKMKLQGRKNKVIKVLTPLVFSIYLIHVHPLIIRNLISKRFAFYIDLTIPLMILAIVGTTAGIFLVCIAIDSIREFIFKKLEIKRKICYNN